MIRKRAILALADGRCFDGCSFGAEGEAAGEVVFNTSMTGYQEILTDPSYEGQLVAMTYPQIGNVGINPEDVEDAISSHPAVAYVGVVGVHDTIHGENVWAYITLRDGAERPTSQDVIRFARDRVGYKAPEVIVVLDEMPLTATGKVDRESLKRMAADRVGAHPPG